jgi:hypothetical protein
MRWYLSKQRHAKATSAVIVVGKGWTIVVLETDSTTKLLQSKFRLRSATFWCLKK